MKTLFANFYRYLFFCCLVFAMGLGLEARAAVCEQAVTGGTVSYILVSPGNYRVQYTCDYILTGVNNCNFQYNASSTPGDYATLLFQKADSDGYVWAADFSSTLVSGQLVWGFYCAFAKDGGGEVVVNPFPNTANVSDFTSCALPDAPVYTPSLSDIIVYSSYDNSTLITNYNEYTNVTAHEAVTTEGGYDVMKLSMGGNGGSWATHGAFLRTSSLNISGMDYIHVDLYVPDPGEATPIRYVRLGIGEEYTYYSLAEVSFNEWMSVEIPITNFPTLGAGKLVSFNNIEIVFTTNKSADIPAYTYSFYFDNLYFYNAGCGGAPATSAPTPNRPAAKVKSVYSDTYVREDVTSFSTNPLFGFAANATEVEVPASSGNHAYVYENIAKTGGHYQIGYQTNQVDVSSMDGIHFDIFTTKPFIGQVRFVGQDGGVGFDDNNHFINVSCVGWNSVDVEFSHDRINQIMIYVCNNGNGGNGQSLFDTDVYVDNIYYYSNASAQIGSLNATMGKYSATLSWIPLLYASNPTQYTVEYSADGGSNWTTVSTTATSPYVVHELTPATNYTFRITGTSGLESASATIDGTTDYSIGSCDPTVIASSVGEITDQTLTLYAQKVSDTSTLLSLTSATSTLTGGFGYDLQNVGGGTYTGYTYSVDADNHIINYVLNWSSYPTSGITIYLVAHRDNSLGGSDIIGATFTGLDVQNECSSIPAPPAVENEEAYTKHLYVSRYQTVSNLDDLDFYSGSTGSTIEAGGGYSVMKFDVTTADNKSVMVSSNNGALSDVSDMNYLHVDIYFPDNGTIDAEYIRFGQQEHYIVNDQAIVLGEWNSFDIPLSAWGNSVNWAYLVGTESKFYASLDPIISANTQATAPYTIYVDNWYFYKKAVINILSSTTTYNSATLTWSPLNYNVNPSAYTIQYSTDGGANWTTASTTATSPYVVSGLNGGIDYTFKVTGTSSGQTASATVDATTNIPVPPTYTYASTDVISVYSTQYGNMAGAITGDYCNVTATNDHVIDGSHTVKKYTLSGASGNRPGYGFMWIAATGIGDAFANYDTLHVNVFIPDNAVTRTITKFRFYAAEVHQTDVYVESSTFTLNAWNQFDLPISSFSKTTNAVAFCIVPMVDASYPASSYTLYMDNLFISSKPEIGLSVTTTNNSATLSWEARFISNPSTYTVQYSTDGGANWTTASAEATSPYTINDLASYSNYRFRVSGTSGGQTATAEIDAMTKIPLPPTYTHDDDDVLAVRSTQYGSDVTDLGIRIDYCNVSVASDYVIDPSHTVLECTLGGLTRGNADGTGDKGAQYGVKWKFGEVRIVDYTYAHFDIFIPDDAVTRTITKFSFYLADQNGDSYDISDFTLNAWNSFDIPTSFLVTSYIGNTRPTAQFMRVVPKVGDGYPATGYILYLDNFMFYNLPTEGCDTEPSEPAPTPTMPEDFVLSLYSDAYTMGVASLTTNNNEMFSIAGTAVATTIDGNNVYKYENLWRLGFGIALNGGVRLPSNMNGFMFDIWAEKPTTIHVRGRGGAFSQNYGEYNIECGWNTIKVVYNDEHKTWLASNNLTGIDICVTPSCTTYVDNLFICQLPAEFTFTKRLAAQRVCHVQTDANIRRIQVYSNDGATKYIDQSFATPVGACDLNISELATGTYKVLVYDTAGRIADVKVVTAVY